MSPERARSEMPAAPIAAEMTLSSIPAAAPSSPPDTVTAIDQRIERLLSEMFAILAERKALTEKVDACVNRSSELLQVAREGRALARAFFAARARDELEDTEEIAALREWAEKPL